MKIQIIYWVDTRRKGAYKEPGDVITFGITNLTNKYDMLLASFIGVGHHDYPILLSCALLSNKQIEYFSWAFENWLAYTGDRVPPRIIIEQNKAMQNFI